MIPDVSEVMEIFNYRCPKCRRVASTVHELVPRSRGIQSMFMQNRTAICYRCHREFHKAGASEANIESWRVIIRNYLTNIGRYSDYVSYGK